MGRTAAWTLLLSFLAFDRAAADEPLRRELVKAGEFVKIYDPSVGEKAKWYINDHCFIHGDDGLWHLFGITHQEPANPMDEVNFAHATAKTLLQQPWEKKPFALSVAADPWKEIHLWAPHVIRHDGLYYMFYCAGDPDHTKYKIHLATSKDLRKWTRHKDNPMVVDGFDARDPYVTRVGDRWVMYYTATSDPNEGNHVVACVSSNSLTHWTDRKFVFVDPSKGKWGGPTESPFVVQRSSRWYLFIGPRDGRKGVYNGTDVFLSPNPFQWNIEDRVGHIASHAAEIVRDRDGKWYVSRCGWGEGGVYLAPLVWNDGLDDKATNVPVPQATQEKQ
jgi:arabinan endo-1,5-alpha-L-arabinosidase